MHFEVAVEDCYYINIRGPRTNSCGTRLSLVVAQISLLYFLCLSLNGPGLFGLVGILGVLVLRNEYAHLNPF